MPKFRGKAAITEFRKRREELAATGMSYAAAAIKIAQTDPDLQAAYVAATQSSSAAREELESRLVG